MSPRSLAPGSITLPTLTGGTALLLLAVAAVTPVHAQSAYALTAGGGGLDRLDLASRSVQSFTSAGPFANGDTALVDLGLRPADGLLYGFAASGDLYRFQQLNGDFVGGQPTLMTTPASALGGVTHGAFSPASGNLTLVSTNGHTYTETLAGQVTDNGVLAYQGGGATPSLAAIAFAPSATLFGLDSGRNALVNLSTLSVVGSLGTTLTSGVGLSFAPDGRALLTELDAANTGNVLYQVDLASGAASLLGPVSSPFTGFLPPFQGLAIVPEPSTRRLLLLCLGAPACWWARRRRTARA